MAGRDPGRHEGRLAGAGKADPACERRDEHADVVDPGTARVDMQGRDGRQAKADAFHFAIVTGRRFSRKQVRS